MTLFCFSFRKNSLNALITTDVHSYMLRHLYGIYAQGLIYMVYMHGVYAQVYMLRGGSRYMFVLLVSKVGFSFQIF